MAQTLQIRNVPQDVHRTLKVRAAQAGMSLSEYLLREMIAVARRPTLEEIVARIRSRPPARAALDSARAVRAEREAHRG
jgi:plasmid stability protein